MNEASNVSRTNTITNNELSNRFKDIMNDLKTAGKRALKDIPVELLTIDTSYQTLDRTNRESDILRLASHWDENKLEPITVVPHVEECRFYVVNGYGRWQASQMQKPKYEYLCANVLLGAMKMSVEERRKFESELFAYQNREVSKLKPIQLHGALKNLGDPNAILIEEFIQKYKFSFVGTPGRRNEGVFGSYSDLYITIKRKGAECLEYIFSICAQGGFDRKPNGYASYIIRALQDIWSLYPADREATKMFLSDYFRQIDPIHIRADAQAKYPILECRTACSLLIEDKVIENLSLSRCRAIDNGKVIKFA